MSPTHPSPLNRLVAACMAGTCSGVLLLAHSPQARAATACVNFEPTPPLGTTYGTPSGQTPGTVVLFANGVIGTVERFATPGGGSFFNLARVENPPTLFGTAQSLRLNNTALRFHFFALPFRPVRLTFRYLDLGGIENLAINGNAPFMGQISTPPAVISGFTVNASSAAAPGGRRGTLTIQGGALRDVSIGGQELWIDQVCANN
jgi:hypothetical protein